MSELLGVSTSVYHVHYWFSDWRKIDAQVVALLPWNQLQDTGVLWHTCFLYDVLSARVAIDAVPGLKSTV